MSTTEGQMFVAALGIGISLMLGVIMLGRRITRSKIAPSVRLPARASADEQFRGAGSASTRVVAPGSSRLAMRAAAASGRSVSVESNRRLHLPRAWLRGTMTELEGAGMWDARQQNVFLGWQMLIALACTSGGIHLGLSRGGSSAPAFALGFATLGLLAGLNLPRMWLSRRRQQRLQAIQLTLPDTIDLLVVCVEAGMGLNSALVRVTREMAEIAPELTEELGRVTQEMRAGATRAVAFRNLAERLPIPDLESLIGILIQAERMGGSISLPLRTQSQLLRTRRRQRAEELGRKATVKLIFPLVFFIFPVILIVMLGPALYDLLQAFSSMAAPD